MVNRFVILIAICGLALNYCYSSDATGKEPLNADLSEDPLQVITSYSEYNEESISDQNVLSDSDMEKIQDDLGLSEKAASAQGGITEGREDDSEGAEDDAGNDDSEDSPGEKSSQGYGYGHGHRKRTHKKIKKVYVPVYVPDKEKKKMKIINVDKGSYIPGGYQLPGKFKSLKHCMKACAITPTCFSGDYNPWLHKCYGHSNQTACNRQNSHPQFIHFSKVPCSVTDAPTGSVALGVSVANGIEQKGIDSLQQCLKKCASAGGGIQPSVGVSMVDPATMMADSIAFANAINAAFGSQACFAIDYDFQTHKCFFFGSNVVTSVTKNPTTMMLEVTFLFLHCAAYNTLSSNRVITTSLNAMANPTSVHITLCPVPR